MWLHTLHCNDGEVENERVNLKFIDKFALLVDKLLLELALVWIVKLLRAHEEAPRILRAKHSIGLAWIWAFAPILDDGACDFFLTRIPLAEWIVDILGQQYKVLLVRQVLHAEFVHLFHEGLIVDEVFVFFLYRVRAVLVNCQRFSPRLPELAIDNIVFLLLWQSLVDERLQVLITIHGRKNCLTFLFVSLRRHCCHCNHHGPGCQ